MQLFPFFSFPISEEELKELFENLRALLENNDNQFEKLKLMNKPITLGRTEHLKIDIYKIKEGVFNVGFLHNVATPVLSKEDINKLFKDNKDLFEQEKLETVEPTIDSELNNP